MADLAGVVVFRSPVMGAGAMGGDAQEPAQPDWPVDYLVAREQAERAAANRAQSSAARGIHQELAQYYAELARQAR